MKEASKKKKLEVEERNVNFGGIGLKSHNKREST